MSVAMMTKVWALDIPHHEQAVLLALADHADDRGGNCFPSMGYVAWKLGYSDRQVRRIVSDLRQRGVLIITRPGSGRFPPHYRLHLGGLPQKAAYREAETDKMSAPECAPQPIPDKMSDKAAAEALTLTPVTADPDTGDRRDDISDAVYDISDAVYDIAASTEPSLVNRHLEPSPESSPESSPRARARSREADLDGPRCERCGGDGAYSQIGKVRMCLTCAKAETNGASEPSSARASPVSVQPDANPPPDPDWIAREHARRTARRKPEEAPVT